VRRPPDDGKAVFVECGPKFNTMIERETMFPPESVDR